MRLKIIRALRATFAHLVNLMDTIVSFFKNIIGRAKHPYLKEWEASLGKPRLPEFPPKQVPGTPKYRYSRLDFNTRIRTAVILTYADRSIVEALLPSELELEQVPDAPPGKHPVMLSFGLNSGFSAVITPWRLRTITYLEFLSSIPNTRLKNRHEGYCGPFLHPARLWATNLLAVLVGKALAFPKEFARIDGRPDSFTIRPFLKSNIIASMKVTPMGMPAPAASINQAQAWYSRVNQPIMTETGSAESLFCHFQFEWDLAHGQAADMTLTVYDDSFPIFPKGTYQFPALRDGAGGGIMIASPCQLQLPFPRWFLRHQNPGSSDESNSAQGAVANRNANAKGASNKLG
jgi:hypothetical protein